MLYISIPVTSNTQNMAEFSRKNRSELLAIIGFLRIYRENVQRIKMHNNNNNLTGLHRKFFRCVKLFYATENFTEKRANRKLKLRVYSYALAAEIFKKTYEEKFSHDTYTHVREYQSICLHTECSFLCVKSVNREFITRTIHLIRLQSSLRTLLVYLTFFNVDIFRETLKMDVC